MLRKRSIAAILALSLFGALSGCAERPPSVRDTSLNGDATAEVPAAPAEELIYAEGWDEIVIRSAFTDTKIDSIGHFTIERNNCRVGGYGALPLEVWNPMARAINRSLTLSLTSEEKCISVDRPAPRDLDGFVNVRKSDGGKLEVLTAYDGGYKVCTRVGDSAAAAELLKAINVVLPKAFSEDCSLPVY